MEDRWAVQAGPDSLFGGVYDGHGGVAAAARAAADLHRALFRLLGSGEAPAAALRQAIAEVDAAIGDADCGTTAAVFLLAESTLTTAHLGDSRIVLVRREGVETLTRDHRLDDPEERARVLRTGAEIEPPYLVRGGRGLMVTRALGDRWFRPVGVVAEPEIASRSLAGDEVALVAATDGVWDVLAAEDAARIARPIPNAHAAADALVQAALRAGAHDNLTALVVRMAESPPGAAAAPIASAGATQARPR
jgi:serine/threonine protein phosphatase PrpC